MRGRGDQPDVCVACYRLPEATCRRCHRRRPCNFAASDQPICQACTPRATAICAHCGNDRPPTARWPQGPVCDPCYTAALRRRGRCAGCGHTRRLVDPAGPEPTRCATCADAATPGGHVCDDCGIEDKLYARGRCVRCALARRAHQLLADDAGDIPAALAPVHAAIAAARQPYTAHNWLRTGAGAAILADLSAGRLELSHETLDSHPRPHATDYLRRMLTAHGVLEARDEQLARTDRWIADLLDSIARPPDRRLVATYATWRVLRRLRRRAEHTPGPWTATHHAKTQLTAAVRLLDWLADHDTTLADASQGDIDTWLTTSPSAHRVRDFLAWAAAHNHCQPLTVPPPVHRTGTTVHPDTRWALLSRLLHDDTIDLTDRVAGSLLLCYAQQLSRITALTVDQITRTPQATTIRFGASDVDVPEPLAGLIGALTDTPRSHVGVGAPATSRWLIPGHLPGRPLTPARLGARLAKLGIDARAGRRAALLQLAAELPAAVLADMLNLTPGTAVRWVNNAGGDWSRYAAALANQAITNQTE